MHNETVVLLPLQANSSNLAGNSTIYNSVTQKLRKERGQNLDAFICTFMQSIEQSTDVGEDVIEMKESKPIDTKLKPPGQSSVFGDLFGMKSSHKQSNKEALAEQMHWIQGPSECLIFISELRFSRILIIRQLANNFSFHFSGSHIGCESIYRALYLRPDSYIKVNS